MSRMASSGSHLTLNISGAIIPPFSAATVRRASGRFVTGSDPGKCAQDGKPECRYSSVGRAGHS